MLRKTFSIIVLAGLCLFIAGCLPFKPSGQSLPQAGGGLANEGEPAWTGAPVLIVEESQDGYDFSIVPVSSDRGEPVEGMRPVMLGGAITFGFSKDRSQMAFLSSRSEGCQAYCLRIMDLRQWTEMIDPIPVEKSMSAWFMVPEYDQKNDVVPLIINHQNDTAGELLLVDVSQGSVAARVDLKASILQAVTTPEGDVALHGIMTNRTANAPLVYLALLDGRDLSPIWEKTVAEIKLAVDGGGDHSDPSQGRYYQPASAFSPDGGKLYLIAADRPVLVTVDFQKQTIAPQRIERRANLIERLIAFGAGVARAKSMNGISKMGGLSKDGRFFYVVGEEVRVSQNDRGEYVTERIPLGLQVIDTRDGALVREMGTTANQLLLSGDGGTILLYGWDETNDKRPHLWTDVVDTSTWEVVRRLDERVTPSRLLDGRLAWLADDLDYSSPFKLNLYRPGEAQPRGQVTRSKYADWIRIPE